MNSKVVLLNSRPEGRPTPDNFKFTTEEVPTPADGEVLLKTYYVSVDPYIRGRMNDAKSYAPPYKLQEPIVSGIIAEVVESRHEDYEKGTFISARLGWKEYQVAEGKGLQKVDTGLAPLSAYLGILGMPGLTAHLGFTEIGQPKKGETVVISGAAGAVGSIVGQIARLKGCRVVGIAGSDEKIRYLKNDLHFDQVINYKNTTSLKEDIRQACPDGVDIYFDNVGGEISDQVIFQINKYARIIICGQIALYNLEKPAAGPRIQPVLLTRSALMKGFIVSDFAGKFPQALQELAQWLKEGKISFEETIVAGFDNIPQAFLGLFEGRNKGKMLVKVS